jgi:DNA-directed RNA polymerase specialized sigma24 family protein
MNAATQQILTGFYEAFADALRARIRFILHDPELSEDVLQEVFVKACCKWETLASHAHPYGWLYRVATTTAIDAARHQRRFAAPCVTLSSELPDPRQPDPQESILAREHLSDLLSLTREQELALLLREASTGVSDRKRLWNTRRNISDRAKRREQARGGNERRPIKCSPAVVPISDGDERSAT